MNELMTETKPETAEEEPMAKRNPEIPSDVLKEFVGYVPNFLKIDQHFISHNRYRINVWTRDWPEGRYCPTNSIARSFFVEYDGKEIRDKSKK